MRRIIAGVLRSIRKVVVTEAEDGGQALALLGTRKFDLVISDWNMPVMSGIELLKAVREDPFTEKVPFLMVTGEATEENIAEAAAHGVSDYIVKPFNAKTLDAKLRKILD